MEKVFLRKRSQLLELIGSIVVAASAATRDIYEPIMYHLGVSGGIVKHGGVSECHRHSLTQRRREGWPQLTLGRRESAISRMEPGLVWGCFCTPSRRPAVPLVADALSG